MPLRFEKITTHKKRFLDLLLLADEQESMIDRYLERGEMFVARDDGQVVAECVVTDEADRIGEIKNLAVPLQYQRKGYGRQTLEFLEAYYRGRYRTLRVGTGDVPRTLRFYERWPGKCQGSNARRKRQRIRNSFCGAAAVFELEL